MTEIAKARLGKLLALLQEHRDNGVVFDLSTWIGRHYADGEHTCKTAACACGLFVLHNPEEPLKLCVPYVIDLNDDTPRYHNTNSPVRTVVPPAYLTDGIVRDYLLYFKDEAGEEHVAYKAAAAYFGISELSAESMFSPDRYGTNEDVVPIEDVIARVAQCLEQGHVTYALFDADDDYYDVGDDDTNEMED